MNSILEFEVDDWNILKNIFININEIIDEIIIECSDSNLKFKGIDRGHICFFEGEISTSMFDEFFLEKPLLLYIDLHELVKVLKRGNVKDSLIFKADMEVIEVIFKNNNKRSFSVTQIDLEDNMKNIPSLNYSISFEYGFDSIKNTLKDAELYSDRLTFVYDNGSLIFKCEGTLGKYENNSLLKEDISGFYSSTYSLDWLFKIFNRVLYDTC